MNAPAPAPPGPARRPWSKHINHLENRVPRPSTGDPGPRPVLGDGAGDETEPQPLRDGICILGFLLVVGALGWIAPAFDGRAMPDGLGVVIGTVAGDRSA